MSNTDAPNTGFAPQPFRTLAQQLEKTPPCQAQCANSGDERGWLGYWIKTGFQFKFSGILVGLTKIPVGLDPANILAVSHQIPIQDSTGILQNLQVLPAGISVGPQGHFRRGPAGILLEIYVKHLYRPRKL